MLSTTRTFCPLKNFFGRRVEVDETDDEAMNGGKVFAFARPLERLMNKINYDTTSEKITPQQRDDNSLHDRIGDEFVDVVNFIER